MLEVSLKSRNLVEHTNLLKVGVLGCGRGHCSYKNEKTPKIYVKYLYLLFFKQKCLKYPTNYEITDTNII